MACDNFYRILFTTNDCWHCGSIKLDFYDCVLSNTVQGVIHILLLVYSTERDVLKLLQIRNASHVSAGFDPTQCVSGSVQHTHQLQLLVADHLELDVARLVTLQSWGPL